MNYSMPPPPPPPPPQAQSSSDRRVRVRIEVHIDVLCPWSFLQKRSLDLAMRRFLERYPLTEFDVVWRPYFIQALLRAGMGKPTLYTDGDEGHSRWDRILKAGHLHGIEFSLVGTTGSTRDAHKLIMLALWQLGSEAQGRVVDALFRGHFEGGKDVMDRGWLGDVGEEVGLTQDAVRLALGSDDIGNKVEQGVKSAMTEEKIEAVPCVTVQGKYRIGGYQEAEVLEDLFAKVRNHELRQ